MAHFTTSPIPQLGDRRIELAMDELLLATFHAGYCAGARLPLELPDSTGMADLLLLVEARHRVEIRAPRNWGALDPPMIGDELPGWLLRQPQQADAVRARAAVERERALGDAAAPEGL